MITMTQGVAAELSGLCSTDDATLGVLLASLRRSLAREAIDERLYEDLNAVLDEYARPAPDEIRQITARFRKVATGLVEVVPYLVTPYPTDEIRRLIDLSPRWPRPEHAHRHVVRFAMAIVAILDLMGDEVSS